jgi:hypothetical protein
MKRHAKDELDFAGLVELGENPRGATQLTPQGFGRPPNGEFPDGVFNSDPLYRAGVDGSRWNGPSMQDDWPVGGLPVVTATHPTHALPGVPLERKRRP